MAEKKPLITDAADLVAETGPQLVATTQIKVGEFVAHNVGDEVPAANVEANGWEDFVAPASADGA